MIYNEIFEKKTLACLLRSLEFNQKNVAKLEPEHFDGVLRHNVAKIIIDYFKKYRGVISSLAIAEAMSELKKLGKITEVDVPIYIDFFKELMFMDISDMDFISDELIKFIKEKECIKILEAVATKHLPKLEFEKITKLFNEFSGINNEKDVEPYHYFDSAEIKGRADLREFELEHNIRGISTGIPALDRVMPRGGYLPKELYIVSAPAKRGKSMYLGYAGNIAALQGSNVVIFSCEVSTRVYSERLDAMNANVEIKRLPEFCRQVASEVEARGAKGRLIIFEYPTKTLTSVEIERQLKRLELDGIQTHMLIVDYADLMKSMRKYDEKLHEEAHIYQELRGIATSRAIPVLTASQINRSGASKQVTKGTDTSGTFEKIMICDLHLTLSATEADSKKNEMTIHLSESRNGATATCRIKTAFNFGRFFVESIRNEEMT